MKKQVNGCTQHSITDRIKQNFPILFWIPRVTASDMVKDVIAGIAVGIFCVPQGFIRFFFLIFVFDKMDKNYWYCPN